MGDGCFAQSDPTKPVPSFSAERISPEVDGVTRDDDSAVDDDDDGVDVDGDSGDVDDEEVGEPELAVEEVAISGGLVCTEIVKLNTFCDPLG